MVETEGTWRPGVVDMWEWIVSGPASRPSSVSPYRMRTISSLVEVGDARRSALGPP